MREELQFNEVGDYVGGFLKRVRKYKGLSVEEVSKKLNITETVLYLIENNSFAGLDTNTFIDPLCSLYNIDKKTRKSLISLVILVRNMKEASVSEEIDHAQLNGKLMKDIANIHNFESTLLPESPDKERLDMTPQQKKAYDMGALMGEITQNSTRISDEIEPVYGDLNRELPHSFNEVIGELLQNIRKYHNFSVNELAVAADVSVKNIIKIENGRAFSLDKYSSAKNLDILFENLNKITKYLDFDHQAIRAMDALINYIMENRLPITSLIDHTNPIPDDIEYALKFLMGYGFYYKKMNTPINSSPHSIFEKIDTLVAENSVIHAKQVENNLFEETTKPISFYFNPKIVPPEKIAELLGYLNEIYSELSDGDELIIKDYRIKSEIGQAVTN